MRPRLLDLFSGAGGCAKGYQRAGFYVVGVDDKPQPNYCGDEFIQMDALGFMEHRAWRTGLGWAAIAASPPCQGYSDLGSPHHPRLIGATRELLQNTDLPYVIENIEDARDWLIEPVTICGTMFDPPLDVKRHRLFEANWPLESPMWPCRHRLSEPRFDVYEHGRWRKRRFVPVYGTGGGKAKEHWAEAMGIDWMVQAELKEAVPPAYTELIGHQLVQHLKAVAA